MWRPRASWHGFFGLEFRVYRNCLGFGVRDCSGRESFENVRHIFEDSRSKKVFAFAFAENGQNKWKKDSRWLFWNEKRIPGPGILEDLPHIFNGESSFCAKNTPGIPCPLVFVSFEQTQIRKLCWSGWPELGWADRAGWAGLGSCHAGACCCHWWISRWLEQNFALARYCKAKAFF